MSKVSDTMTASWQDTPNLPGLTTASLLTVVLVATVVGAFAGMCLDGKLDPPALAVIAGLLGTLAAVAARNTILIRVWTAARGEDAGTSPGIIPLAAAASLVGSLAAYQLSAAIGPIWSGVTGMLAGLLSACLVSLLMVAARMQPEIMESRP